MKTVFWHQRLRRDEADVFIIDGNFRQGLNETEIEQAFSILLDGRKWPHAKQPLSFLKRLCPDSSAEIEIYYEGDENAMVQSHSMDKDDAGRLIPYMFYTDNASDLPAQLERNAELAGLSLNPADLKLLRRARRVYSSRALMTISGILVGGIILYMVCK